ncbi:MAG: hypothetical protein ABIU05_03440, partial [Nitrospirales bacterium]
MLAKINFGFVWIPLELHSNSRFRRLFLTIEYTDRHNTQIQPANLSAILLSAQKLINDIPNPGFAYSTDRSNQWRSGSGWVDRFAHFLR